MRRSLSIGLVILVFLGWTLPAQAEKRVALVIGNNSYATLPGLHNAVQDAKDVAAKLKGLGFEVILKTDAGRRELGRALSAFEGKLSGGDAGLVFYAGHGIQADGKNYLIPTDARVEVEEDLRFEAVEATALLDTMRNAGAPINVVILDACRDNPLPRRSRSASRGLTVAKVPSGVKGVAMLYSAGPGESAQDGPKGGNGVFTGQFLQALEQPGLTVEQVFKETARRVNQQTHGKQTPWINTSLTGDFYFKPGTKTAALPLPTAAVDKEALFWQSIQDSRNPASFEAYLSQYPNGAFAPLAQVKVKELKVASLPPEPAPPSYQISPLNRALFIRGNANLRELPSVTSNKKGLVGKGAVIAATGQTVVAGATWYRIAVNGTEAFIHESLVSDQPVMTDAPVAVPQKTWSNPDNQQASLTPSTGPAAPAPSRLTLKAPDIAENGAVVPVSVDLDRPLAGGDVLRLSSNGHHAMDIQADQAVGLKQVSTRLKFDRTGDFEAVVLRGGQSVAMGSQRIKITIGDSPRNGTNSGETTIRHRANGETIKILLKHGMYANDYLKELVVRADGGNIIAKLTPWVSMNPYFGFTASRSLQTAKISAR
ncbi:hypothetical protein JCM17960_00430 [Magnetospira thiophila]